MLCYIVLYFLCRVMLHCVMWCSYNSVTLYLLSASLHHADEALLEEEFVQQPESKRYTLSIISCSRHFITQCQCSCSRVDIPLPPSLPLPPTHSLTHPLRAKQHAKSVSWLRKTEYISTEFARPHSSGDGAETK